MRKVALFAALAAVLVAALVPGGGAATSAAPRSVSVGVPLNAIGGSGARGLAYFQLRGQTLRYTVVVFGLEPDSRHAAHIHGPKGACTPASKNRGVVVPFPDLRADENGVAYASGSVSLRQAKEKQVLRPGFYYNVHEYSTAELASQGLAAVTCGNIR